jgi:tight adherence protein C
MGEEALILGAVFVAIVVVFVLVAILTGRKNKPSSRLSRYGKNNGSSTGSVGLSEKKERNLQQAMAKKVLKPLSRLASLAGGKHSKLVEQLVHAGIRRKGAAELFLGAKAAMATALPLAIAGFLLWQDYSAERTVDTSRLLLYCPMGLVAGLMIANLWLRRKVNGRKETIKFALPNALDLLVVCIESGLALDAALVRIGKEMEETSPELSEELTLLNMEVSAGKPRDECLRNLGLRTGVEEVKSLVARIIQSSKFGTNLARSLRIHAESLREKRRQEAEERAAKTTVKLLFPLVFFIFPAIFVVILGPAMVRLAQGL